MTSTIKLTVHSYKTGTTSTYWRTAADARAWRAMFASGADVYRTELSIMQTA